MTVFDLLEYFWSIEKSEEAKVVCNRRWWHLLLIGLANFGERTADKYGEQENFDASRLFQKVLS